MDHQSTELFKLTGAKFVRDGSPWGDILSLQGTPGAVTGGLRYDFSYTAEPNFKPDVISPADGQVLFTSQDSAARVIGYRNPVYGYRSIVSSFVFTALLNGKPPNTREALMQKYIDYLLDGTKTGVTSGAEVFRPSTVHLKPNFPNPFNQNTVIEYELKETVDVMLTIYASSGQLVETLVDSRQGPGTFRTVWNTTGRHQSPLAAGIFFAVLKTNHEQRMIKLVLIK